ncbi:ArsA family ATPase [Thermocrispum municipale]|uniref:ArsA family ATPase n=1 Tax=Thermocrispum municipale TaxID=37926 RepID=UPI00040FCBCB|nr:ArsA family ATPase [Thermocrispum municipale]
MRLLLFTGKGGVGKTTLAAATGATLASHGRRTLVISTDPAHSLADAYGVPLGPEPKEVTRRLDGVQIDSRHLVDAAWEELRRQLRDALAGAGLDALDAEELTVLPGIDELLALTEVRRLAMTKHWHSVVVDCGPTAETLRLLALPEAIAAYLRRLYGWQPWQGSSSRTKRGVASSVAQLGRHLESLRDLLTDHEITSVRLVLTPERVVVAETRRTLTALALRGIKVDGLIANRLMPAPGMWRGGAASWLRARRKQQDEVLAELRGVGMPELTLVEHRAEEPVGLDALADISQQLYRGGDPLAPMGEAKDHGEAAMMHITANPRGGYRLRIAVPLDPGTDVDLARVDDDLAITIDGFRRLVALPRLLRSCAVVGAESDAEGIVVHLGEPEEIR